MKVVLRLKYIFLGVHIEDKDAEFQRIAISYSNLNDWISAIHDLKPERSQERTIYNSSVITVYDECMVQITSSPTFRREDSKPIREDNIQFIIESINDKSFYHYLELESRIRDFLNFVITKSVIVKSFERIRRPRVWVNFIYYFISFLYHRKNAQDKCKITNIILLFRSVKETSKYSL